MTEFGKSFGEEVCISVIFAKACQAQDSFFAKACQAQDSFAQFDVIRKCLINFPSMTWKM